MKFSVKVLLISIFAYLGVLLATQSTVTNTADNTNALHSYWFTFTNAAAQDTAILVPTGASYYNIDDYEDIHLRFDTGETTADSVRWSIQFQVKTKPSDSWVIAHTFTDTNSTAYFLHANILSTYGRWPLCRILMIGAAANNAVQAVTGQLIFVKDRTITKPE